MYRNSFKRAIPFLCVLMNIRFILVGSEGKESSYFAGFSSKIRKDSDITVQTKSSSSRQGLLDIKTGITFSGSRNESPGFKALPGTCRPVRLAL